MVKPVRSETIFSRAQIDLVNMQTLPDKDYKYILTYVNHFTKFCVLTPVKSKRAEEVAEALLPIFLTFGAPVILQSDNGREFVNAVISELSTLWPDLQLVTGRPRHPQSQGAVERLNGVIQDKLRIWMSENKSTRWSIGLKFVQWQINISHHLTVKNSPFKVTFGEEPKVGLGSTIIPSNVIKAIRTEEELEAVIARSEEGFEEEGTAPEKEDAASEVEEESVPEPNFVEIRQKAAEGQEAAATRMKRRATHLLKVSHMLRLCFFLVIIEFFGHLT